MDKDLLRRLSCPILCAALCGAILLPNLARTGEMQQDDQCQSHLKQMGLAVAQYTQDYDETYPTVMTDHANFGWGSSLQPYMKNTRILRCPDLDNEERKDVSPRSIGYTDYWYNERLQKVNQIDVRNVSQTILFGDGNDGQDGTTARYSLSELPQEWLEGRNSPCYRHKSGANYAFADGHVKRHKPGDIKPTLGDFGPTFSVTVEPAEPADK